MNRNYRFARFLSALLLFSVYLISSQLAVLADAPEITDKDKFSSWTVVGPSGGDVRAVVVDPRNKDRVFLSTLDGQIYVSDNGGGSWQLLANLNRPQLFLDNLIIDSRDSKIIYASGHRGTSPGGFFMSKDGGVSWKEAKELRGESIHAMT